MVTEGQPGGESEVLLMVPAVLRLVEALEEKGIQYCHWKSNDRLVEAAQGITDLDLLFQEGDRQAVIEALASAGFVGCRPAWHRSYPGIEDHVSADESTGVLVHAHVHFQLVVGERTLKPYRLPWEATVLGLREMDAEVGLWKASPEVEMMLLLTRMALKRFRGDAFVELAVTPGEVREFGYLRSELNETHFAEVAAALVGQSTSLDYLRVIEQELPAAEWRAFSEVVHEHCTVYRRMDSPTEGRRRLARKLGGKAGRVLGRLGFVSVTQRRRVVGGGAIVAVMGADGSGKSTLVTTLSSTIGAKLDVVSLYMGSGDGRSSLLRMPFDWIKARVKQRSLGEPNRVKPEGEATEKPKTLVHKAGGLAWSMVLASEKRAKLWRAKVARERGALVVCDRYPQTSVFGFNDGPRLQGYAESSSPLLRAVARWEYRCYDAANVVTPDIIVKLIADPEVLHARRPEMAAATIVRKQRAVQELPALPGSRVVTVDASMPQRQVLTDALSATWQVLRSRS